jgi:hypothetical protein
MPDEEIFHLDVRYGGVSMIEWSGSPPIVRLVNAPPVAVGSRRRDFFPAPDPNGPHLRCALQRAAP